MPNNQNRGNNDFSRFDNMKNEELEEILRSDAQNPEGKESDLDKILYVMEVLAARKKNSDNPGKSANEAFESFKENYYPLDDSAVVSDADTCSGSEKQAKRQPRMWLRRVAAVAATLAIICVGAMTAQAFGFDIIEAVGKWTQATFQLGGREFTETSEPAQLDTKEYGSLQEILPRYDIPAGMVPSWLPDGYELFDIQAKESPVQRNFLAVFYNDDKELKIQIIDYLNADPQQIEKNDELVEIYEVGGVSYYIFSNYDQLRAVWISGSSECYISGQLDMEDLKNMIDSITED